MRNKTVRCVEYEERAFFKMQPGAERRKAIIDHLHQNGSLLVNLMYCLKTYNDPDLIVLLKKGIIKVHRTGSTWYRRKRVGARKSYIVLV